MPMPSAAVADGCEQSMHDDPFPKSPGAQRDHPLRTVTLSRHQLGQLASIASRTSWVSLPVPIQLVISVQKVP